MQYRIYWISTDDHIVGADDLECGSDQDAMTQGSSRRAGAPAVELWQGTRRVARIGMAERKAGDSTNTDSKGQLLERGAKRAVSEHKRWSAEHAELREATRQLSEKNEELRGKSEALGAPTRRVLQKE